MATASPKVLREWCRATCAGYRDVEVKDWGSSFRSGLAFCAIIHKHRPELIDFSRLSKDNAFQNIKLAFEIAETKLGVPMLLEPKEVTAPAIDPLAVVTYVSQLYLHFNKKSTDLACVTVSAQKTKSLTHSESTGADSFSATKPRVAACHLCFRPVHLIQRRLADGKIYHRKCFRCKRCHLSLLPSSNAKGNITNSLLCPHHAKTHRDSSSSRDTAGYLSLSGLAVSSVPHYPTKTPPPEKLVCKDSNICSAVVGSYSSGKNTSAVRKVDGNERRDEKQEAGVASEDTENISGGDSERGRLPVPAPRSRVTSYGTTSSLNMSSSASQGTTDKTSGSGPGTTQLGSCSSRGSSRVRHNHPWLNIVHPGIWHQLPPAPPIVHNRSGWYRPRTPAPNPFEEDNVTANPTKTDRGAATEENSEEQEKVKEVHKVSEEVNDDQSEDSQICAEESAQTSAVSTDEAQSNNEAELATASENSSQENVSSSPSKVADESSTPDSESSQLPVSPGHGFPLIKRKVQTDLSSSPEDLHTQVGQVAERLEALEEQGVELERSIRGCSNNKAEEKLLKDWFCLVHQRHELQRKDTELVHLIKQQELEQRQEDVEYELRCLLNKPEEQWTDQDREQEQRLMQDLLNIIEQRNQIISSLDQDAQRERAEDVDWNSTVKNKDVQKRELKELKKSKGKFRTTNVFKILNKKSENQREKKS